MRINGDLRVDGVFEAGQATVPLGFSTTDHPEDQYESPVLKFNASQFYLTDASDGDPIVNLGIPTFTWRRSPLINVGSSASWSHGLGRSPDFMHAHLVCVTAGDDDYVPGDVIPITTDSFGSISTGHGVCGTWFNSTTCHAGFDTGELFIQARAGGGNVNFTASRWKVQFVAFLLLV
jgi:hypothetical protein